MPPVADAILDTVIFFAGVVLGWITRDNHDLGDDADDVEDTD